MSRKKKGNNVEFDAQFDAFLKASVSSDESSIDTARVNKFLQGGKQKQSQQSPRDSAWWMNGDDDSVSDRAVGLSGTGRSFLKKKMEPVKEKPQNNHKKQSPMPTMTTGGFEVDMSRDSLDDTSLRGRESVDFHHHNGPSVPALALDSSTSFTETATENKTHPGLETLQEMREKEEFFENLNKNSGDSTIDYSRLNRDLDKSATLQGTLSSEMGKGDFNQYRDEDYEYGDEDEEEDDEEYGPETVNDDMRGSGTKKPSMLSKVALMDSLESTLGTKYASQDSRPEDMKPIQELTEREDDDTDGHDLRHKGSTNIADSRTMEKTTSEHTGKGMTLKTGTGTGAFGFTDTSHEIEALQAALRQAGMSTMGSTRDFTLHGSSSVFNGTGATPVGVGESHMTAGTADGVTESNAFGHKTVAPYQATDSRTVDDIIKEVDELRKTGEEEEEERRPGVHFENNDDDDRGYDLSPAHTQSEHHGFDLSPVHTQSEHQGFDLSPVHTGALQTDEQDGEDLSPLDMYRGSHPLLDYDGNSSSGPVPAPRSARSATRTRKTTKEKYPNVNSSGYGKLASPPRKNKKDSSSKNKKPLAAWTPAGISKPKNIETEMLRSAAAKARGEPTNDGLVASVQSFAKYIQTHYTESQELSGINNLMPNVKFSQDVPSLSSSQKIPVLERERALVKEVKEWQDLWREEQRLHAKFKAQFENAQRDYERKLDTARLTHEEELFKLKQENYVLSAKVAEDGDSGARRKALLEDDSSEAGSTVSKEKVALLEKEVREQEGLLAGYQAENERLYQELKKMQKMTKTTEQQMFKENQKLQAEVSSLKQHLEQKELALRHQGLITGPAVQQQIAAGNMPPAALGAGRIALLESELKQARSREETQKAETRTVAQAKREVEVQLEHLSTKLKEMEHKVKNARHSQSREAMDIEAKYQEETDKLTRRLKWYAENQELLDRDHQLLKKKDEEIKTLKNQLENLNTEHGRRQAEAKARVKERAGDARKITDLQRQVREMESIIRKRHPNSLPVLMWAANAAEQQNTVADHAKPLSVKYLEEQCKKLEVDLDSKDEECKKSLRVVEQKYTSMKYQYEDRIKTLELTVGKYEHPGEGEHPHSHSVALQRELDSVRDRYKKQVAEQEGEIDRLKREVLSIKSKEQSASKADLRAAQESQQDFHVRIRALEGQVLEKEKERASLQVMLDRVQKEKQQLNTELVRQGNKPPPTRGTGAADRARKPRSLSRPRTVGAKKSMGQRSGSRDSILTTESEPLPAYPKTMTMTHDKQYEPGSFTGVHIEDVLREKNSLKTEVEQLKLENEHHRVNNQKLLAEAEGRERRASEQSDEHVNALRLSHQVELHKLMAEHAMSHSTSRVAELQGRLDTQEIMVKHLKDQLSEFRVDTENTATLRVRNTTLESQVTELLSELQDAKMNHTPEMRHYTLLQDQIRKLESRHQQREQELKQIIVQAQSMATADMEQEVGKWKKIVDGKNREIEKFRAELDTILQVLSELQRQGVVLPSGSRSSGSGSRYSDR